MIIKITEKQKESLHTFERDIWFWWKEYDDIVTSKYTYIKYLTKLGKLFYL